MTAPSGSGSTRCVTFVGHSRVGSHDGRVSSVDAVELVPGLWRWTARHPAWVAGAEPDSPDDWDPIVGCVLYESEAGTVFIDPLVPADADDFWSWADRRVAGRPAFVFTTLEPHGRSRNVVAERYNASLSPTELPPGVVAIRLHGAEETVVWLPAARALIPGDRLLGAPGGELRMCPESWLYWVEVDQDGLRELLRPLLELPIELVVVSHGDPVLSGGASALRRCLAR